MVEATLPPRPPPICEQLAGTFESWRAREPSPAIARELQLTTGVPQTCMWVVKVCGPRPCLESPHPAEPPFVRSVPVHGHPLWTKVDDGWIGSYTPGREQYGEVWWFSPDGSDRRTLEVTTVNQMVRVGDAIWLLAEAPDAIIDDTRGVVQRLARACSTCPWSISDVARLEEWPRVGIEEKTPSVEGAFIATIRQLLFVRSDGHVETLHRGPWEYFRLTSVVKGPAGDVFIGAQGVVIHLTPQDRGYRESWLTPP